MIVYSGTMTVSCTHTCDVCGRKNEKQDVSAIGSGDIGDAYDSLRESVGVTPRGWGDVSFRMFGPAGVYAHGVLMCEICKDRIASTLAIMKSEAT